VNEPFLISDEKLQTLSATRQGRVSIAGYNYQAAYAVARLAAMTVRQPVLGLNDWPRQLRYDWGEDLDEVCEGNAVLFTQCKRVDTIGQPASLAEILLGFAPKWLWTPDSERGRVSFRLVCSDTRFATESPLSETFKLEVREHFLEKLKKPAGQYSDRAVWVADAEAVSPEELFDGLWNKFKCIYLPPDVVDVEPAGPRLAAEKEALRVLLERGLIDSAGQSSVLGRLRRLIHDNLITFDPTNQASPPLFDLSPRRLDRADVNAAIDPWRPATHRQPPFLLVDRTFLSEQRELTREQYVARQPDWRDVAHGYDATIKFIERDQTGALESAVREKVIDRLGLGGKLPALFVAGAPGDGKTTIVRRVAAKLVDSGELLIADTGVGLREPPGEPDEYVQAIERLQSFGRPIVLLLDDPLYAESPWLDVLKKLNRPGLKLGVLAASPQFLFNEHQGQLRAYESLTFEMARTSQRERESLAAVYGRAVSSGAEEDFLVVAMEAAAGVSFREIIDRLWLNLADGRDLSSARTLSDLPWQTRAYLFVCFFSRAYEACPEPLLLRLLEMTGGVPGTSDVRTELQRVRHFAGWRIFRIGQRSKRMAEYQGRPITAAHTLIARYAWEQRPLPWCDMDNSIIEASVVVPESIYDIANLAVRLRSKWFANSILGAADSDFARKVVERWGHESGIETRYVALLVSEFLIAGEVALVRATSETFIRRARPDSQGWLAALSLWFLRHSLGGPKEFPAEVDLLSLIRTADFSVAPNRASQFAQRLKSKPAFRDAFVTRLLDALDGKLSWSLDGTLLTYLFAIAPASELWSRIPRITEWLEIHATDTTVRTRFLSFLHQLPAEFSDLRAEVARQTVRWLEEHGEDTSVRTQFFSFLLQLPPEFSNMRAEAAWKTTKWLAEHGENASVRAQFLSYLLQLPAEFSNLRADAVRQTAKWLEEHGEDTFVRTQFLAYLLQLPAKFSGLRANAAQQTATWLEEHGEDTSVRTQFLSFLLQLPADFSTLRGEVARQTAKWLEEHGEDTSVRTQFLSFLLQLPAEFSTMRADAARQTAKWLEEHGEDTSVRAQFLFFLLKLPAEFSTLRANAARQTAEWLEKHGEDTSVRTQFMAFLATLNRVGDWQRFATDALGSAAELVVRSGWPRHHETLINSFPRVHRALLSSLTTNDSEAVRKALQISHDAWAEWWVRNASAGVPYDLPLP
jgi:L-lactate utilization protein LutC